MTVPPHALAYLQATAILVACWSGLAQLEWAVLRGVLRTGGILEYADARRRMVVPLRRALPGTLMPVLTILRLAGAGMLIFSGTAGGMAIGFALTIATAPVMSLCCNVYDGSDKMGLTVAVAGLLGALGLLNQDALLAFSGVLLAGGQLTLSYAISGISKLRRADWRAGTAIAAVMSSQSQGHPQGVVLTRSAAVNRVFCWAFMLAEALFPLTVFAPAEVLIGALAIFLTFHFATAYFMGFNTFFWAFPAAFPATLLLGQCVRGWV